MLAVGYGLAAMLGHLYPVYLKFKGGRGVATGAGAVFAIDWRVGLVGVGATALFTALTRVMSVGSIAGAIAIAVAGTQLLPYPWVSSLPYTIFFFVAALVVILRHIPNLKRLAAGTEPRIFAKRDDA